MKQQIVSILLFLFILNLTVINSISIDFQGTEFKKADQEKLKSLEPPPAPGISQAPQASSMTTLELPDSGNKRTPINEKFSLIYYQGNQFPVAVNKYVLSHKINSNYTNDTICILIQATNIGDKSLENVEIYEVVPSGIKIINSSIPVKTSSIDESLKYMRRGHFLLCKDDISNQKDLLRKLISKEPPSNIIIKFDSTILNNSSNKSDEQISEIILKRFNEAIINTELDNRTQFIDTNYLSKQTKTLIKIHNVSELQGDDRRLLNFMLMRDIYPTYIRKDDEFIKIIETFDVEKEAGFIRVSLSRMRPKESLMFIYYANTSNHESQKTTTIVSIPNDIYPNHQFPLEVAFPSPKFDVRGDYSRKEVQPGDPISIKYIVTLLSPIDTSSSYLFDAFIENNDPTIEIQPEPNFSLIFPAGINECEITRMMIINEPGSYNLPSLSLNNNETSFDLKGDINVEPLWHKYIFEITIMFLAFFTLIGNNFSNLLKKEYLFERRLFSVLMILIIGITCYLCEWYLVFCLSFIIIFFANMYWKIK